MSDGLRTHLAAVHREAHAAGRPLLAAWRERASDAPAPLERFAATTDPARVFWSIPARALALAASGAAAQIETRGPRRFADAAAAARALFADLRVAAAPTAGSPLAEAGPMLLGGFAFRDEVPAYGAWAGLPALRLVMPERLLICRGAQRIEVRAARVAPDADVDLLVRRLRRSLAPATAPPARHVVPSFAAIADRTPDAYRSGVRDALAAIARGDLEKVVLARSCRVARRGSFDVARVLSALCAQHPECTVFGVGAGSACFVGATPERLLRRDGLRVQASALAGSAPRGRTPAEDLRLASALRESKKEQAEHAIVRRAIAEALAPACEQLDAPEAPGLLQLDDIQHLHTQIEGRLRPGPGSDLLELAGRLHPTPAVGGAPRDAACSFLTSHEPLDRGWYAGGVGWLSPSGDGELAVALRCALLRGRHATLYAGAGIVEGSDPDVELSETRLKLRAALSALVEI